MLPHGQPQGDYKQPIVSRYYPPYADYRRMEYTDPTKQDAYFQRHPSLTKPRPTYNTQQAAVQPYTSASPQLLRNRMDGMPLYGQYDCDADMRYRRSKELFEQSQAAKDAAAKFAPVQQPAAGPTYSSSSYPSLYSDPHQMSSSQPTTLLQQQQRQQQNFYKQQAAQALRPPSEAYRPVEQLTSYVDPRQPRSHSADAQRFYHTNQEIPPPTDSASRNLYAPPQIQPPQPQQPAVQTTTAPMLQVQPPPPPVAQHTNPSINILPLNQQQQPPPQQQALYPTTFPLDLAQKLHAQHSHNQQFPQHQDISAAAQYSGIRPQNEYDDQLYQRIHDMSLDQTRNPSSLAAAATSVPNKIVSFNVPPTDPNSLSVTDNSLLSSKVPNRKLSELFPDCDECRRLEESRRLYRASLKLKRNNSETSWNEFIKENDYNNYISLQDEEHLKNLARLVQATFSGDSDSAESDPRIKAAQRAYRGHLDYGHKYNAAGQKIPTVPYNARNSAAADLLFRLDRNRLLDETEKRLLRKNRTSSELDVNRHYLDEPFYLDVEDGSKLHSQRAYSHDYLNSQPHNDYANVYDNSKTALYAAQLNAKLAAAYSDYDSFDYHGYDRGRSRERTSSRSRRNLSSKERRSTRNGDKYSPEHRRRSKDRSKSSKSAGYDDGNYGSQRSSHLNVSPEHYDDRGRSKDRNKDRRYYRGRDASPSYYYDNGLEDQGDYEYETKSKSKSHNGSLKVKDRMNEDPYGSLGKRTRSSSKERHVYDKEDYGYKSRDKSRDASSRRHSSHEQLVYIDRNRERVMRDGAESSSSSIDRLSPDRQRRSRHLYRSHDKVNEMEPEPRDKYRERGSTKHLDATGSKTYDRRKLPEPPHTNSNESGYSSAQTNSQHTARDDDGRRHDRFYERRRRHSRDYENEPPREYYDSKGGYEGPPRESRGSTGSQPSQTQNSAASR